MRVPSLMEYPPSQRAQWDMPTHASAATFRIDLADDAAQRHALEHVIVPGVRDAPDVVAGRGLSTETGPRHWDHDWAPGAAGKAVRGVQAALDSGCTDRVGAKRVPPGSTAPRSALL